MALTERMSGLRSRMHLPRRTVRLRLTLIYGAMFLVAGVALLAITYGLVHHFTGSIRAVHVGSTSFKLARGVRVPQREVGIPRPGPNGAFRITVPNGSRAPIVNLVLPPLQALLDQQRSVVLGQLLLDSGIALALMTLLSIALGWLVAGRVLRPLRTITGTVRTISADNLHERLALGGPDDEIRELGDTFDGLLGRLEASFEAHRQFVANASHELRTPLTRQRTLVEVALRDPHPTVDALRATHERVLASGAQQERLIEALLTLTRVRAGLERKEVFDLATVADRVLAGRRAEEEHRGLEVHTALAPAPMTGDPGLVERLVANLVDNAVCHNVDAGRVEVATETVGERAILRVTNTGPEVPSSAIDRILQPFQRLGTDRTGHGERLGLGLSIVQAIADAHGATLEVRPRRGGGLVAEVGFTGSEADAAVPAPSTAPSSSPDR